MKETGHVIFFVSRDYIDVRQYKSVAFPFTKRSGPACGLDNTVDDDVLFHVLSSKSKQEVLPGKKSFKKECQLLLRMSSINFSLYYS